MASWVHDRVEATIGTGGMLLWQKVLLTEWGGMNDVLFNLYQHTGDQLHLTTARRFEAFIFTQPLAAGRDTLGQLPFPHANFHLPEIAGLARAYELLCNATDKAIVDTFFSVLTTNHSYATGGSNSGECWQEPRDLGAFLTDQTEESCTQYNVLKIARSAFMVSADAKYADFYETAIWNGIVGNQKRESSGTSYTYMLPLGGANFKGWGKSDYGFPCCWGTLSESFAKLGDSIFFASRDNRRLHVNQFVSATVRFLGGTIEQTAYFPQDPKRTSAITVRLQQNASFAMMVRVPSWAVSTNAVLINGQPVAEKLTPGSFVSLDRNWSSGDRVELFFPLSLWVQNQCHLLFLVVGI
jgi:DUF1680 family protein